ncbi:hypothetical protein DC087_13785 [Clostridioides difficile]|nr:hypothetical protein [Clostridioides difficile]
MCRVEKRECLRIDFLVYEALFLYKIKCIFIILTIKKSLSLFEKALFNLNKNVKVKLFKCSNNPIIM